MKILQVTVLLDQAMTAETEMSLHNFSKSSHLTMTRLRLNVDIVRCRSWAANMALEDGYDVLWMVDHDVGFGPEIPMSMVQLLGQDVDGQPIEYIAAPYPKRNIDLRAVFEAGWFADAYHDARAHEQAVEVAARNAYEWPHVELPGETVRDPGILRVKYTGAGMTMVSASLLKRMNERFGGYPPEGLRCKARRGPKDDPNSYREVVQLFHQIPTRDGLLSEDHSFGHRVNEAGASQWLYIGGGVCSHTGSFCFKGDLRDVLKPRG